MRNSNFTIYDNGKWMEVEQATRVNALRHIDCDKWDIRLPSGEIMTVIGKGMAKSKMLIIAQSLNA